MDATKERARRKSKPTGTKAPKIFPDLQVGIYRGDKLVRVASIPDPRTKFIEAWNAFDGSDLIAAPLRIPQHHKYAIWLVDPSGDYEPEQVATMATKTEALGFQREWNREPLGLVCKIRPLSGKVVSAQLGKFLAAFDKSTDAIAATVAKVGKALRRS
jgi:hypothetical protein